MSKLTELVKEHEDEAVFNALRALLESVDRYSLHLSNSPAISGNPEFIRGMMEIRLYMEGYVSEFDFDLKNKDDN